MQLFFAKKTFSDDVLMWWKELHKGCIMRDEEPCRTLNDMKAVLQRRFGYGAQLSRFGPRTKLLNTKLVVRSSWGDTIVGDVYLPAPERQAIDINSYEKKLGSSYFWQVYAC
jgi:hypothetical protein